MRDFHYTLNILVKAYLDGTLIHGDCQHCAVGEIVHAAGAPYSSTLDEGSCGSWKWAFYTEIGYGRPKQVIKPFGELAFGQALKVIEPTGYSWEELAQVEKAFEQAGIHYPDDNRTTDEAMFDGLMSVVDVLAGIHGIDLKVREEAKALFVKA